jgi:putative membrane protein
MSTSLKVLLGVLGGAVLVLVVLPVFFATSGLFGSGSMMGQGGMMDQGDMMGGWGVFGMAWMVLLPLLFIGGPIALAVWAVMVLGSGRRDAGSAGDVHEQSAEEIVRQRFARGEIDAEEYEERRRILREESPAAPR